MVQDHTLKTFVLDNVCTVSSLVSTLLSISHPSPLPKTKSLEATHS